MNKERLLRRLKRYAAFLYPFLLLTLLLVIHPIGNSVAGTVRNLTVTQSQPGKVNLALGRSTAISFPSKPERLVPGSPSRVAIDFLGNDITIIPLAQNPGNLIVYTKSGRYVILFELGSAQRYDDVVNIHYAITAQPLRLLDDSYRAVSLRIELKPKNKKAAASSFDVMGLITNSNRRLEGDDLWDALKTIKELHCRECSILTRGGFQLYCVKPITEIRCDALQYSYIKITRSD